VGITAGSREVPGRNASDRRHTYCIIIISKPYDLNTALVEGKNRNNASSNRGNWDYLKSFRKYLSNIPGKHEINKSDVLGTAHLLRKVLM